MKSVFVVSYSPPSDLSFRHVARKVFSSREKADAYVEAEKLEQYADKNSFEVEEFEVDEE